MSLLLVNNDGGGIFEQLPVVDEAEHFEQFFATPHGLRFKSTAEQFDIPYTLCEDSGLVQRTLKRAFNTPKPQVVEILTSARDCR